MSDTTATGQTPAHDFLLPRLRELVTQLEAHGVPRDAAVAVMIDIVTGSGFNTATPDPREDTTPGDPHFMTRIDEEAAIERGPAEARSTEDGTLDHGGGGMRTPVIIGL